MLFQRPGFGSASGGSLLPVSPAQRDQMPSSGLCGHLYPCAYTHTIHLIENEIKFKNKQNPDTFQWLVYTWRHSNLYLVGSIHGRFFFSWIKGERHRHVACTVTIVGEKHQMYKVCKLRTCDSIASYSLKNPCFYFTVPEACLAQICRQQCKTSQLLNNREYGRNLPKIQSNNKQKRKNQMKE